MKPQFQDRRLKPLQAENQLQPQPPPQAQPQKCPRCDSLNTKFCYYNNYSLSQPRFLCKTCRRYWTQGGTLRNVPVGGGCRKGKRAKQSSQSSDNTRSQLPSVPQRSLTMTPQHIIFSGTPVTTTSSPYFNRSEEQGFASNWVHSFGSEASDIYQMIDHSNKGVATSCSSSQPVWSESYINNSNSMAAAATGESGVWTASNSSNVGGVNPSNNITATTNYSSPNLSQWPDYMPGFCPPP